MVNPEKCLGKTETIARLTVCTRSLDLPGGQNTDHFFDLWPFL